MSYLVRQLLAAAALTVPCAAQALDWRFVDRVTPPTAEHALICHLWNAPSTPQVKKALATSGPSMQPT